MNISVYRRESIQQLVMGNAFPHDNKDCIVTTDSSQYLKIIFIINQNGHGFRVSGKSFHHGNISWKINAWNGVRHDGGGFFIGLLITVRDNIYVTFILMMYFSYSHEFKIAW